MQVVDEDNLIFLGNDGETITVTVTFSNTVYGVTYTIDGVEHTLAEGDSIKLLLKKKADGKATKLRVFYFFVNSSGTGGFYDSVVSGSLGGSLSVHWPQANQDVAIGRYTLRVE